MGVERFFSSLKEGFDIIKTTEHPFQKVEPKYLFIDFNSIVHVISSHMINMINECILKKEECIFKYENIDDFENDLLNMIDKYLFDLLRDNIKPEKLQLLSLCVDGVPTMAKINEQRKRRYMGAILSNLHSSIDKPFSWARNNISPGTNFMDKLQKNLNSKQFKNNIKQVCPNIKEIIVSDTSTPGEGEMKIVNYIKHSNISDRENIVVYSPDSDMIILLLLLDKNLTILRYDQQLSKLDKNFNGKVYNILYVNNFKKILLDYILNKISHMEFEERKLMNDFIFILTVFGDDFLPKLEPFKVSSDFYILIDFYLINLIKSGYLLEKEKGLVKIRPTAFMNFIKIFSEHELLFLNRNSKHHIYSNYWRVENDIFGSKMYKFRDIYNDYLWKFIFINKNNKDECKAVTPNNISSCIDREIFSKYIVSSEPFVNLISLKNYTKRNLTVTDDNMNKVLKKIFMENYFYIIQKINGKELYDYIKKNNLERNRNGIFKNYRELYYLVDSKENIFYDILEFMYTETRFPFKVNLIENHQKLLKNVYDSNNEYHKRNLDRKFKDDKILYKIEKKLDEYFNILNPKDEFYSKYFNVGFPKRDEISKYYDINFNVNKEDIIKEYLSGLNWVVNYYFNYIIDKTWYYQYSKSPLLFDIIDYNNNVNISNILTQIKVDKYKDELFLTPLEQLLLITPINLNKDLGDQLRLLDKILPFEYVQKVINFIQNNSKYYFDLDDISKKIMAGNEKIIDCSTTIFVNKCHLLFLEERVDLDSYINDFRKEISLNEQRKYYPLNI